MAAGATMGGFRPYVILPCWAVRTAFGAVAAVAALSIAGAALAQTQQVPQPPMQLQPPAAPPAAPPQDSVPPATRPGFIDAVGHWIQGSVTDWHSGLQDATGVAKDAANGV